MVVVRKDSPYEHVIWEGEGRHRKAHLQVSVDSSGRDALMSSQLQI